MMRSLEEIAMDAKLCATNCWWEAHDRKAYTEAGQYFAAQEEIIAKYCCSKPDINRVAATFAIALRAYDMFINFLNTGEGKRDECEATVMNSLLAVYKTLDTNLEAARYNADWWKNFARYRIALKIKDKEESYKRYFNEVIYNLILEHKARYNLDFDTATGVACLLLSAIHLSCKKNWDAVKRFLTLYYNELFLAIEQQK
ncbi:MAG: hypothetical protein QW063_01950 [Candidatus Nanoarchaeia archaeon]